MLEPPPLLEVQDLRKHFSVPGGVVRAVDGISFSITRGQVMGLVGESGSGKSTIGKLVLRLLEPTSGKIAFDGIDISELPRRRLRALRRRMQMIFQDPYASLNPTMRVRDAIGEALTIHGLAASRVPELLQAVGLAPGFAGRFPHELSGGQRQRVSIARALAVEPDFIVADEAVSALDVSNQAQIINLLLDLRRRLDLTILFISHNLAVVQNIADTVAVIYLGRLMELAPAPTLFATPHHPYTIALLSSIPIPDPDLKRQRIVLTGDIPSAVNPPSGCVFRTRCPVAMPRCAIEVPPLRLLGNNHISACLRD